MRICIVIVMFLLAVIPVFGDTLTVDEVFEKVWSNNPQVAEAEIRLEEARNSLELEKKNSSPTADLSNSYNHSGTTDDGTLSTSLSIRHTLADGGSDRNSVRISTLNVRKAENDLAELRRELLYSVRQSYFRIMLNIDNIENLKKTVERRRKDLILIRLKYNSGKESLQAVGESESNLEEARYRLLRAEKQLEDTYFDLSLMMDKEKIFRSVPEYTDEMKEFEYNDLIGQEISNRSDLDNVRLDIGILSLRKSNANSAYNPGVSASLTKRFSGDSLFENESWSAGLSYSLNLFDGNRRDETLKGYDLNIQRTEKNLKTRINNIRRAVFSAISDYSLSLKKLDIDKRVLKSKKDIYSLTKLQYEQGTASYFNLQQKEADLTNAETSYINSLFNLRNNLAKLQYNIGRSTL